MEKINNLDNSISNSEKEKVFQSEKVGIYDSINKDRSDDDKIKIREERKIKEDNKIQEIKSSLDQIMKKKPGYSFSFKPESVWNPKDEDYNFDPISKITNYFKRFSKEEIEKRTIQKNNEKSLTLDIKKYGNRTFDYTPGDGVIGVTGKGVGVLAKGFRNCSALVFQKGDGVSVLHISPESLNHHSDYSLKDTNVYSHISSALNEILENQKEKSSKETKGDLILGENEINELQKLFDAGEIKATMIHGEGKISLELPLNFATRADALKLPYFKTDSHYVGGQKLGTGFSVYANPESIYVIGENNNVIKSGVNLPPTMIDFKEKDLNKTN
jgi:hypothetical protein